MYAEFAEYIVPCMMQYRTTMYGVAYDCTESKERSSTEVKILLADVGCPAQPTFLPIRVHKLRQDALRSSIAYRAVGPSSDEDKLHHGASVANESHLCHRLNLRLRSYWSADGLLNLKP